jgi:hypothetical protein
MQEMNTIRSLAMSLAEVSITIRQLLTQETINQHRIGELYNYTVAHNLAKEAGYDNALDYFADHIQELPRSSLMRYSAVAKDFTAEVSALYGVTRLSQLLTYEEAAKIKVNNSDPGPTEIEVPDAKGRVEKKAFASCTTEDMRKAILRKRKPASSEPIPEEQAALIQKYRSNLAHHFGTQTRVAVVARNHKGKVLLSLKDIPLEEMEKLTEALLDSLGLAQAT